jgi:uncharacterized protein YdhG (YjbR/CyaY superfamily)
MKTNFTSVDDYIDAQADFVRPTLNRVRSILRKALPKAEEAIAYQMPVYRLDGERVIFFAGWKRHYSLYPASERLVEAFRGELARYEVSKGTIRFPLEEPVPAKLIERIAKFRGKEVSAAKAGGKKKA